MLGAGCATRPAGCRVAGLVRLGALLNSEQSLCVDLLCKPANACEGQCCVMSYFTNKGKGKVQ